MRKRIFEIIEVAREDDRLSHLYDISMMAVICLSLLPLMFKESEIALLNKVDLAPYCNFNMDSAKKDITSLHPGIEVLEVSCTKGQGIEEWCDWLLKKIDAKKGQ